MNSSIENRKAIRYAGLLTAIFIAAIFLPFMLALFGTKHAVSVQENRTLAPKPSFSLASLSSAEYQGEFSSYFSDHFGFRESILKGTRWYRSFAYNKAVSRHVIVGNDGWLFFNADGSVRDFTGAFTSQPEQSAALIDGLVTKQRWLEKLGVRYLLVPVPGKMSIYPEQLPNRIRRVAGATRLNTFRELIEGHPAQEFVLDATKVLEQSKSQGQVYFKTDTHWNEEGAFAVYQATISKLARWFDNLHPISSTELARTPRGKRGDIALAAGYGNNYFEPTTSLIVDQPCANGDYAKVESFVHSNAYKERPKSLPVVSGCETRQLKAIVVHDSFGAYLKQFLSESFKEVIFMPSYDVYAMADFIQQVQPDVFIDIRVDRRFHLLLDVDPRMTAELE